MEYKLKFGRIPVEPKFWFLDAPLYHSEDYRFDDYDLYGFETYRKNLLAVIYPEITIDVYCPNCERETVFVPAKRKVDWISDGKEIVRNGVSHAHFQCSRGECRSNLFFVFSLTQGVLTKIGQFPSIADLVKPKLQKYRRVLSDAQLADWQRAVGLRAHGIGVGSYVYLRRIIEQLIESACSEATRSGAVNTEDYQKARWPERIKLLARFLPGYLVENSAVYSVLSKGVHELTEEKCVEYFDVMHTTIEIICEEKLSAIERARKAEAGSKALQKVLRSLNDKES